MKKSTVALTFIMLAASIAAAEPTITWWGLTSFRQRMETTKDFTDPSFGSGDAGVLLYATDNATTKLGYQIGFIADVRENITAGLTLRSGLSGNAQVLHQDISNKDGLLPSVQEAFINWQTPFLNVEMGKIPQQGTAMWDVYISTLQTDFRQDDPRDGIFNDRLAALNGVRLSRAFGPVSVRGVYHTDYVGGYYRKIEEGSREFERAPDRNVYMFGTTVDFGNEEGCECCGSKGELLCGLKFDFDYGIPRRAAMSGTNPDSTYADESIWGTTLKYARDLGTVQVGYGYNKRKDVFTISYIDALAQANIGNLVRSMDMDWGDFTATFRYQDESEKMEFIPYVGLEAVRTAYHVYLNKTLWGLDFQPRAIWFKTEIEGAKKRTQARYELTTTVKF